MARPIKSKTKLKDFFTEHLHANESEPVFVVAHKNRLIMKLLFSLISIPMLIVWSFLEIDGFAILLVAACCLLFIFTGIYSELLIGLTDRRLIIITLGLTRKPYNVRSIELLKIKKFDFVSVNNSFWVIELRDGTVIKFTIANKEDVNPDQEENGKQISEFLQGLNSSAALLHSG